MHYWSVWHSLEPISEYTHQFPRFMSEYGFQSFPDIQTIRKFAEPQDLDIISPVMQNHQKNVGGNERIRTYVLREFREPKDFESFLYVSQVMQAEAIKVGAEHLIESQEQPIAEARGDRGSWETRELADRQVLHGHLQIQYMVRSLSVLLITDLLRIEPVAEPVHVDVHDRRDEQGDQLREGQAAYHRDT